MRTLLIVIVVLLVLGGGWYWYNSMQASPSTTTQDMQMKDTNTMDTTPVNQNPPADTSSGNPSGGTSIGVDGSVNVSTGATKEFTVTGSNFKFAPATMTVKKGDTVKITFVNSSGTHDWNLDEFNAHTGVIQGGTSKTVTFVADKTGSFEYYCAVGNHRAMGMKGTLTVTN